MPIYEFEGKRPKVGETSFVHPAAVVIGGVTIGENCYIGPGAVLRGDFGYIEIGDGSNIQENCVDPHLSRADRPPGSRQPHRPRRHRSRLQNQGERPGRHGRDPARGRGNRRKLHHRVRVRHHRQPRDPAGETGGGRSRKNHRRRLPGDAKGQGRRHPTLSNPPPPLP